MKNRVDYKSMSDEQLMGFYQNGEVLAFNELYSRYAVRVMMFLRKKCRSEKLAQDLTQEVFLKLHRSRAQYDQNLPFAPWIFSVTRSVFLDAAKKKNLEVATLPEDFDKFPAPNKPIDNSAEFLQELPPSQKEAVGLRIFDEATFEDIALKLSTSPENARQLFSRGLKQLKARMIGGGKS